jgi:hypothetical protein
MSLNDYVCVWVVTYDGLPAKGFWSHFDAAFFIKPMPLPSHGEFLYPH